MNVIGKGADGTNKTVRARLLQDEGQAHLTALGGEIQIERALSIVANTGINPWITFPERHENIDITLATLRKHGVSIVIN